jgi:hypothetical protein
MNAILSTAAAAILLSLSAVSAVAQTSSGAPPVSSQTIQETQQNQDKKGKVILQRSIDENGQTVDGPAVTPAGLQISSQPATGQNRVAAHRGR